MATMEERGGGWMTAMYSLPDLSRATGVSESTVRRYAKTFAEFFPCEGRGRLKAYKEDCLEVIRRTKELFDAGYSTDQVRDILGGEFAQIYEVEPQASTTDQIQPAPGAHELIREFTNAIERNAQAEHDMQKLRQAIKVLGSQLRELRSEQKSLPDPGSMEQVLSRLSQLEKRVTALENERNRSWWRKFVGKSEESEK
jgi:DNA-binding transcriptional MerR regulator